MKEPIISVSGLRGIVGESLTPDLAVRFASSFATGLVPGSIVVSRDGRATGRMLADAIHSGLNAVGRTVIDAGVAATPTTGVLVRQHTAAGGIQISASHNPLPYNGMKLFDANGQVLTADVGEQVVARFRGNEIAWVDHQQVGRVETCTDTLQQHLKLLEATVDVNRIRACQFKVLLDSNHGAGSRLGVPLLEALGCQVTSLGDCPDGQFAHPPEPTAENLESVLRSVTQAGAQIGFCQDPDADRLAVVDEHGSYLGEEYTLALCLNHVLRHRPGPIVTNCATSRMAQDLADKYQCPFFRSQVGEANVVAVMQAEQAVFGGEGNGGPIDPRVGYVRDSFVGMVLILDALAQRQTTISQLAAELPRYEIHKTKVQLDSAQVGAALDRLAANFADAAADRQDGLRLDWPDRWLLVRASNTEPFVRVIAEAPSHDRAVELCRQASELLRLD